MLALQQAVPFTKMHGLGNDYLYIDIREWDDAEGVDWSDLSRKMSERHFGVGADGIILITRSQLAPVGMRIFNSDGSESEMCGNGLRALAKWLFDRGHMGRQQTIETGAGLLHPEVTAITDGEATRIRVDMGPPHFSRQALGMMGDGSARVLDEELTVAGELWQVSAVSMGNPHLILFGPLWDENKMALWGPQLETDPQFTHRINVHSVEVVDSRQLTMRHWERGAGLTLACGTGVCAAAVAAVLTRGVERQMRVNVPGGSLEVQWDRATDHVFLEGPAVEVFEGRYLWR